MRVNGIDLRQFSRNERRIITMLALASPRTISTQELIEYVYPDPDREPDYAHSSIVSTVFRIRRLRDLGGWRIDSGRGRDGYRLERVREAAAA